MTTLFGAIELKRSELFRELLASGCDPHELTDDDNNGFTPFRLSALIPNSEYLQMIIDSGVDIHQYNKDYRQSNGELALHDASRNPDTMQILLEHGVNINAISKTAPFRTVLHKAVSWGSKDSIAFLIDKGMNPYENHGCVDSPYNGAKNDEIREFIDSYVKAKKEQSALEELIVNDGLSAEQVRF